MKKCEMMDNKCNMIRECPICGYRVKTKFKLNFEDLLGSGEKTYTQHVGLCPSCGFVFTQNPFTSEQLDNRYKNMSKFEYDAPTYVLDNDYKRQSHRQKHFLEENLDFSEIHSILEVGASSGYNLSLYKDKCERILGIEPSALNCRLSMEKYGVKLFNGMFDEFVERRANEQFDLVFLSMVLEHIVSPGLFIEEIETVKPKYIFIEVPTLDLRHQEEPMGIFAEEHVNLFTLDSLNKLMTVKGYSLVNVENIYGLRRYLPAGYPAIATIWKKSIEIEPALQYNVFSSEECLDRYISDSIIRLNILQRKIAMIPDNEKLALWGVGHHVSMLLANSDLHKKNIVKVYDSDSRKHGIKFAGIEISAFEKKDIEDGDVDGILITTYTAQKAILRYIEKLNLKCRLYTLYDL